MATQRLLLLPWMKRLGRDDAHSFPVERRLQVAVIQESAFVQMLRFERRRTERSGRRFMLVLLNGEELRQRSVVPILDNLVTALSASTRETDVLGWYEQDRTLGLLLTEIGQPDAATVQKIVNKISNAVRKAVSADSFCRLTLSFRLFPEEIEKQVSKKESFTFYPDLAKQHARRQQAQLLKRMMDIVGSVIALLVFLPVIVAISILVKLTSKGPVLFCQKRVGQHGNQFGFLKFRTMYVGNDPAIHREYITKLIAGKSDLPGERGIYKLVNDPRVTPLGRFLRRSSLDELPQFINILRCEMSLVGPRPPLPYEYERYEIWHKRRVLELKPGLTGLWQVHGRSRTSFNEMVRMDLKYANVRSFWVDCKILLQTPAAMVSGRGAC